MVKKGERWRAGGRNMTRKCEQLTERLYRQTGKQDNEEDEVRKRVWGVGANCCERGEDFCL